MPIRIEHAPSSAMAALSGLMGGMGRGAESELEARRQAGRLAVQLDARQTMQTQQLREQRNRQMEQIEAAADRQKQAADDAMARTALNFGLDEQIREDEFERQITKMQEAARIQANQFEYQFSAKDRQDIARFNDARQRISRNPAFSPDEREAAMRAIDLQQAGIHPSSVPRDPNKPIYPEGQDIGQSWLDEDGHKHTREPDGTNKVQVSYDKSREYLELKLKSEMEAKQLDLQIKQADAKRAFIEKMMAQQVPVMAEAEEGGFLGYGAVEAGPTGDKRFRTYEEAVKLADQVYGLGGEGTPLVPQTQPAPARPPVVQPPQPTPGALDKVTRDIDLKFTKVDQDLPERVRVAQAFLRVAKERNYFNRKISPLMEAAIREALQIGAEYNATR